MRLHAGEAGAAGDRFGVAGLGQLGRALQRLGDALEIGEGEFGADHFDVADRVDAVHHVDDVVIDEAANDVGDRIGIADVRQEGIALALAFGSTFDQAGDVDELDGGRKDLQGLDDLRQRLETRIRHADHADVRIDRAERIVLGGDLRLGQRVEQGRLADVRETDDAALNAHGFESCVRRDD